MIKILNLKWKLSILILFFLFFIIQTASAWIEHPSNPIYDPVNTAEKAYYPSVLKMGASDYRMWYQSNSTSSNTTVAYATSPDGISWTLVTNSVTGLIPNNAGHPHVEYVDGKYVIWYWNAATPYGNTAMHHAESIDGINWTNDSAITGNLTTSSGGQWNSGIYGTVDVIINNNATNTGTNPFDYKYAMYYDATSGGYEQIALGYSVDGIDWTLYGTGPVLPKGATGSWDSNYAAIGSTVIKDTFWTMWYSGGVSASNEGLGCATSLDGLDWTKCPNNPVMSKNDGISWRNSRTYTPKIISDGDIYKMWFTGRDIATGNYAIGYATDNTTAVAGNLYLKKQSSGHAKLSSNVTNITLNNTSVLNLTNTVNTVSNGIVVVDDVPITISNFTEGDLVDVDLSIPKNIGGKSVAVGKAVKLSSGLTGRPTIIINSELANVNVSIPDNTTIIAPNDWDGIISAPKTASISGDTPPSGYSIGESIEVGSSNYVLLFDKPVQVTLSGVMGSVGYKPAGLAIWTTITSTCGGTYDEPILSAELFPGECSITNGTDTKILTYHLTTFGELNSTLATLHVIKLVVNGSNGTGRGVLKDSDFMIHVKGSEVDVSPPQAGTAAPGTIYSLPAGTYTIYEDVNSSYVKSFSIVGGCDQNGNITLAEGENKTCTIVNTDIPSPSPVISHSNVIGGSYTPPIVVPLIGIIKVPTPLNLPKGPGSVTYSYIVWNVGKLKALTNISILDDKCSPVTYLSGDLNNDKKLDINEKWEYSCVTKLLKTTTNTATVTGYSDDTYHEASIAAITTTVAVGILSPTPLISIVNVPNRLTPLPFGGGDVIYTYAVTNPGITAIKDVSITDNKCKQIIYASGDVNSNQLLDPSETWIYNCQTNVSVSTRSIAMAEGKANGFYALGYGFATVLVSSPLFPETGSFQSLGNNIKTININLSKGSRGNEVKILQEFLISQNIGIASIALKANGTTINFGLLTKAALAEWQKAVGISPASGIFGPITRAYLKATQ